ncbi:MAG: phytoene/squalene synthase family protein [Trueperaceae bacterium]|nr:phytoene/squalene synthase family protein [Trueperaceae bacterium]MDZ7799632.1 phytoene/squalene synthase family protein [Trueperaceae bacterium]
MNVAMATPAPHESLVRCAELARAHSTTFAWGARAFPADERRAVLAIYAACRAGDDAVDEAPAGADPAARLAAWWAGIERAYAGTPTAGDAREEALAWVLSRYQVPFDAFSELHLGLQSDLARSRVETLDELMLYCRRVGGVVGWMITPIAVEHATPEMQRDALALGEAMQLTNILRDVGEDLRLGRLYLPAQALHRYGVREDDLQAGRVTDAYVGLLRHLARRADRLYRQAWRSIPRLEGRAALAVGLAADQYRGILGTLRRNGYDNLTRRASLTHAQRLALVPLAAARVMDGRRRAARLGRGGRP